MDTMIQSINRGITNGEDLGAVSEVQPEKPFQEVLNEQLTAPDRPADKKEEPKKVSSAESVPIDPPLLAATLFNPGEITLPPTTGDGHFVGQPEGTLLQNGPFATGSLGEGEKNQGENLRPPPGVEGNPELQGLELSQVMDSQPLKGEKPPLTEPPFTTLNIVAGQPRAAEGLATAQDSSPDDLGKGERPPASGIVTPQASSGKNSGEGVESFEPGKAALDLNNPYVTLENQREQALNFAQTEKMAKSFPEIKQSETSPKPHQESPGNENFINTLAGNSKNQSIAEEVAVQSKPSLIAKEPLGLIQHIADRMVWSIKHNEERIRLTLDPPQLGKLFIEINKEKNQIQATLWADNALTKEILESHKSQLQKTLEGDGFKLVNYDVLVQKEMGSFQRNEGHSIFHERGNQAPILPRAEPEGLPSPEIPPARLWATDGRRTIDRFI